MMGFLTTSPLYSLDLFLRALAQLVYWPSPQGLHLGTPWTVWLIRRTGLLGERQGWGMSCLISSSIFTQSEKSPLIESESMEGQMEARSKTLAELPLYGNEEAKRIAIPPMITL